MNTKTTATLALSLTLALSAAACGGDTGGDSGGGSEASAAKGPIKIWLSNNPEEIAWGEAMVAAWNAKNPKE
ncbi:MAG: sugar ABC transporter substrate-binding protein, partial [Sporichthyaceae bacterium]|nr:sugar ABC transporter substrate-binding protein [Sporichthyaceae bacterium]